jgi:carboxymethylenebutenolidase
MGAFHIRPPLQLSLALLVTLPAPGGAQTLSAPDTVTVSAGALVLHALLWRPSGPGPFPAILFDHGSYGQSDTIGSNDPGTLAAVFVRHGYAFLFLFRPGVGLSRDQGPPEGVLMDEARAEAGVAGRNALQLTLLETSALTQAQAGLAFLRAEADVDRGRVVLVGHSFGGSLTLLLAARDTLIRAVVVFGAAAGSWASSPNLQRCLLEAVSTIRAPVLLLHTANDYSTAPGKALADEIRRLGKAADLRIYPAYGQSATEGHNFLYHDPQRWEADVMTFLDAN